MLQQTLPLAQKVHLDSLLELSRRVPPPPPVENVCPLSVMMMLVGSDPVQARLMRTLANREGYPSILVPSAQLALDALARRDPLDLKLIVVEEADGAAQLVADIRKRRPDLAILALLAENRPDRAVEVLRAGATDFLFKPVVAGRFTEALRLAIADEALPCALRPLTEKSALQIDFESMIGAAPAFRAALAVAARASRGHGPILIEGEPGTGKATMVRAIHAASARARGALELIKASRIPGNAIGSDLFGHEKGAFAGAFDRRVGFLQRCDSGTVFIDEVDCLPLDVQDQIVEVLATGEMRPIGSRHSIRTDIRLIAAISRPLEDVVASGRVRPELLEAIASTTLTLPPLRQRLNDIPALVRHFLAQCSDWPGLRSLGITDGALDLLSGYVWPRNLRQLQATLFRASTLCEGDALTAEDLPSLAGLVGPGAQHHSRSAEGGAGVVLYTSDGNLRHLAEIECDVIRLAIGHYQGSLTKVARHLGIGRSTLYRKLSDLGIGCDTRSAGQIVAESRAREVLQR